MSADARKPDYNLNVLVKSTNARATIGAGWKNEDGSISLSINPCTHIFYNPEQVFRLFPVEYKPKAPTEPSAYTKRFNKYNKKAEAQTETEDGQTPF